MRWSVVKRPAGPSFRQATVAADTVALSGVASSYDGNLRRLAALSCALQAQNPQGTFFLGCRKAGQFLGIDKSQAWRLLKALQFDGVLRRVAIGTKQSGKASEWRLIDLNQEDADQ